MKTKSTEAEKTGFSIVVTMGILAMVGGVWEYNLVIFIVGLVIFLFGTYTLGEIERGD